MLKDNKRIYKLDFNNIKSKRYIKDSWFSKKTFLYKNVRRLRKSSTLNIAYEQAAFKTALKVKRVKDNKE